MRQTRHILLAMAILFVLTPALVRPDALIVVRAMTATTIAEFFIEEGQIRAEIEIGVADLPGFRDILPDEIYDQLGFEPALLEDRIPRFFLEGLTIRAGDGRPISGRLEEIVPRRRVPRDQITGDQLPVVGEAGEAGAPVVFARLTYPLSGRPGVLTFDPPRGDQGQPISNIGFVVYHEGLAVNDFRYLGTDFRLTLDWADPWYSQFDSRNLRRQYYAPINGFLYIEPFEVRKEIVARPMDLQKWIDLGLEGKDVITVADQEEIKRKVAEFLLDRNQVTIDGQPARGELDRIHFIFKNLRTSGVIDPPRDLDVVSATLGVIFYYPTDGLPDEVTMEWDLFEDRIESVPTSATDEAGALPYVVTPDDPVLRWTNFLTNPTMPTLVAVDAPPSPWRKWLGLAGLVGMVGLLVLAAKHGRLMLGGQLPAASVIAAAAVFLFLVVAGAYQTFWASNLADEAAEGVVLALIDNVYRAFDYRDEDIIYDTLEHSVAGELLTDIYLETRRSLELENQGGARAKVKAVEMIESSHEPLESGDGFTSLSTWRVTGSVGHWGHIHQRINQYQAQVTVQQIDGAWRITNLEVLQEERLQQSTI